MERPRIVYNFHVVKASGRSNVAEEEAITEMLDEGLDDWVTLHQVVWYSTMGERTPEAKSRTIRVLTRIYEEQLMVPGDLHYGFQDWAGEAETWLARSIDELEQLRWNPMNEGHWLRLTPRGEARAKEAQQ